jgi:hypothetical protein
VNPLVGSMASFCISQKGAESQSPLGVTILRDAVVLCRFTREHTAERFPAYLMKSVSNPPNRPTESLNSFPTRLSRKFFVFAPVPLDSDWFNY